MAFIQREVPQLNLICTLTQNNKQTNIDFCPHLITSTQAPDTDDIVYVAYVAKVGFICIVVLQMGCIMSKNTIEIQYSYNWRITSLNMHVVKEEEQDSKLSKGVYLFIGYEDGSITMHLLIEGGNRPLARIFKIKPKLKKKQLIIRALVWGTNLVLSTAYSVFIYHRMFLKQDIRLKQSPKSPAKSPSKSPGKSPSKVLEPKKAQDSLVKQQEIKLDINQCKINIEINYNSDYMYVFNELQGAVCFNLNTLTQVMKIQDSIKVLCVCQKLAPKSSHIIVIGGTDDSIKFIDYNLNVVEKFIGFKNYPSCFEEDPFNEILWVGCLDGTISCFSYKKKKMEMKKTFVMHESKLLYSEKINQNGIKKIIVHKQTLIILDCVHNIQFYDIVLSTMTTDRYASSNHQAQWSGKQVEEVRIGKR